MALEPCAGAVQHGLGLCREAVLMIVGIGFVT